MSTQLTWAAAEIGAHAIPIASVLQAKTLVKREMLVKRVRNYPSEPPPRTEHPPRLSGRQYGAQEIQPLPSQALQGPPHVEQPAAEQQPAPANNRALLPVRSKNCGLVAPVRETWVNEASVRDRSPTRAFLPADAGPYQSITGRPNLLQMDSAAGNLAHEIAAHRDPRSQRLGCFIACYMCWCGPNYD